eukprot:gene8039-10894_t
MRAISTHREYVNQATIAFNGGDHKLCLVLLRNIDLKEEKEINLLVSAAYDWWFSTSYQRVAHIFDDSNALTLTIQEMVEEKYIVAALNEVNEAFAKLLSGNYANRISPYDYIRLTQIYLNDGLLDQSLQILQLASARGHLENSLIIIQKYGIYKRMKNSKSDAEECLNYLSTSITLETISNKKVKIGEVLHVSNSSLPLSYLFLHIANFLRRKSVASTRQKKKLQEFTHFKNILSEAYFLIEYKQNEEFVNIIKWFNQYQLWFNIGLYLESTPFIFLAEDSFWEAFLRDSLDEFALIKLVNSMLKYKRRYDISSVIAKAYQINPWNLFVRSLLIFFEVESINQLNLNDIDNKNIPKPWHDLFQLQSITLTKIQSAFRGWSLRKKWPELKEWYINRWNMFQIVVNQAEEKRLLVLFRLQQYIIESWKIFVIEWKDLTFYMATKIQSLWRKLWCMKLYKIAYARVLLANSKFIQANQLNFDLARINIFRKWHNIYSHRLKIRSATLITEVLQSTGFGRILQAATNMLISILRIKKKYIYKSIFKYWQIRYHKRRIKHAIVTLRFYFRYLFDLKATKVIEDALQEKLNQVRNLDNFKLSTLPLLKEMWIRWKREYRKKLDYHKILRLDSGLSVKILRNVIFKNNNNFSNNNNNSLNVFVHPWESYIQPNKILFDLENLKKLRIFRYWMASFRKHHHYRRSLSYAVSQQYMNQRSLIKKYWILYQTRFCLDALLELTPKRQRNKEYKEHKPNIIKHNNNHNNNNNNKLELKNDMLLLKSVSIDSYNNLPEKGSIKSSSLSSSSLSPTSSTAKQISSHEYLMSHNLDQKSLIKHPQTNILKNLKLKTENLVSLKVNTCEGNPQDFQTIEGYDEIMSNSQFKSSSVNNSPINKINNNNSYNNKRMKNNRKLQSLSSVIDSPYANNSNKINNNKLKLVQPMINNNNNNNNNNDINNNNDNNDNNNNNNNNKINEYNINKLINSLHFCKVKIDHIDSIILCIQNLHYFDLDEVSKSIEFNNNNNNDNSNINGNNNGLINSIIDENKNKLQSNRSYLSCLKELSVDVESFGVLGILSLLKVMQWNRSIQILVIKMKPNDRIHSMHKFINSLKKNNILKELRLFGVVLDSLAVKALNKSIHDGLKSLKLLEFTIDSESEEVSSDIMITAKNRSFHGDGLSVTINKI